MADDSTENKQTRLRTSRPDLLAVPQLTRETTIESENTNNSPKTSRTQFTFTKLSPPTRLYFHRGETTRKCLQFFSCFCAAYTKRRGKKIARFRSRENRGKFRDFYVQIATMLEVENEKLCKIDFPIHTQKMHRLSHNKRLRRLMRCNKIDFTKSLTLLLFIPSCGNIKIAQICAKCTSEFIISIFSSSPFDLHGTCEQISNLRKSNWLYVFTYRNLSLRRDQTQQAHQHNTLQHDSKLQSNSLHKTATKFSVETFISVKRRRATGYEWISNSLPISKNIIKSKVVPYYSAHFSSIAFVWFVSVI